MVQERRRCDIILYRVHHRQRERSIRSPSPLLCGPTDAEFQTAGSRKGAYYYYNPMPGENMLGTLLKVHEYANEAGIPYRHVLLDSWWYYKDPRDGSVVLWEAREDAFAGGSAGMRRLVEVTGWAVTAHNRYWSNRTDYDGTLTPSPPPRISGISCWARPKPSGVSQPTSRTGSGRSSLERPSSWRTPIWVVRGFSRWARRHPLTVWAFSTACRSLVT